MTRRFCAGLFRVTEQQFRFMLLVGYGSRCMWGVPELHGPIAFSVPIVRLLLQYGPLYEFSPFREYSFNLGQVPCGPFSVISLRCTVQLWSVFPVKQESFFLYVTDNGLA